MNKNLKQKILTTLREANIRRRNNIVLYVPHSFFLQNTSCIRKPQVILGGGGVRTACTLPLDLPLPSCCYHYQSEFENCPWTILRGDKDNVFVSEDVAENLMEL